MRSFVLPLAALAASVLAAPKPADDCVTKDNTVLEYYDVTVTQTVYVTEGAIPVYTPVYTPEPNDVVTITYGYEPQPEPTHQAPHEEPQGPPSASGDFIKDMIDTHNRYRALHGAEPLTWSDELASFAEGHTGDCVMHHTGGPYGENLAMGYSDGIAGITAWYEEGSQYDYGSPGFQGSTGHFTQLVWKSTTHLGCHLRQCGSGGYLMCEYQPAGNVVGNNGQYFRDNVS